MGILYWRGPKRRPSDPIAHNLSAIVNFDLPATVLSQSTMFPTGSPLRDVVANCYGNGLKALKAILQRSHPAFVDEPSTLVTTHPKQKDKSLLEYKMEAEDFLQMRSIVQRFSKELDDPGELDIFINNMKCSTFVQRVTRDERRQC